MNFKSIRFFISICILFIGFAFAAWYYKAYKTPPELNKETTELVSETGASVKISDFKGKYVLVNYFQTWCGDCIQELESMDTLQNRVGKDRIKVMLISDEPWDKIKRFKQKYCNTIDYYQSVKTLKSQNIRVFPTSFLLDPSGNIILSKINSFEWDSESFIQTIK